MTVFQFVPIWFDSMGAKSVCTLVKTPEVTVVIDPGIAAMQPGFPASEKKKRAWEAAGRRAIKRALRRADVVVISHYHHDHYFPEEIEVYQDKLILAKNPNEYINDSQRERAEKFYSRITRKFGGQDLEEILERNPQQNYPDPMDTLPLARERDFGDYNRRRRELLQKGRAWFNKMAEKWMQRRKIPELHFDSTQVCYPEGKTFQFGQTRLRFTEPLFHGIDYSRLGWVFATLIERGKERLIHSSDVNGPVIEDYADWIISRKPRILILDGPMTYMFGYLVTKTTLQRVIDNMIRILNQTDPQVILYDHHLPREARYQERTRAIWEEAIRLGKSLVTVAEYLGRSPRVLEETQPSPHREITKEDE